MGVCSEIRSVYHSYIVENMLELENRLCNTEDADNDVTVECFHIIQYFYNIYDCSLLHAVDFQGCFY